MIQLPFNLFDSAPSKILLLEKAKSLNKEIHVRSIFLQGLFFRDPDTLTGNVKEISSQLHLLQKIQKTSGFTMEEFCFGYANAFTQIDHIVIGVDSVEHLQRNLRSAKTHIPKELIQKINSILIKDTGLLNPSTWTK